MRKWMRGVTLMELLVVVVIVGILAALAYPNYRQFVTRAKRNEAKAALLQIATMQERHYLQNNTYTQNLTLLGFPNTPTQDTDSGAYRVQVTFADANNFTAVANYLGADEESTRCGWFQIDGRGAKTSGSNYTDGWSRTR
jgi:type IV pilus assembly protein PilE